MFLLDSLSLKCIFSGPNWHFKTILGGVLVFLLYFQPIILDPVCELIRSEPRNKKKEPSRYLQKTQGVNEAGNLYRPSPSRSKLKPDSIRRDLAKNKTVKTGVKKISKQFIDSYQ